MFIRKLSPEIANQIAAGEVIERPANACKELVENALDAGARRIEIDIEEGGKKLIRVRDDGSGMSGEQAVLSLQRHATSKLQTVDDLYAIRTLGFRGEALPSIAAVSRFEMTTRTESEEAGTHLLVEAGMVSDISETGCVPGTEVSVHNLFFNTPARFKFLKSDSAEAARISEMVGHLALAYPRVAFRLRHNGNETLRAEALDSASGKGGSLNAIVSVLGREIARQMLPIVASSEAWSNQASSHMSTHATLEGQVQESNEVQVSGFVGRPQLTRSNRNLQLFFVNGRVIRNRALQHAIAAAYEGLLHGRDRFPVTVVFLRVPPNAVDVNVHPTKSEVRFAREWEIHHAVRVAVRETLVAAQLAPDWGLGQGAGAPGEGAPNAPFGHSPFVHSPFNAPRDASGAHMSTHAGGTSSDSSQNPNDYQGFSQPVAPRGGDLETWRDVRHNINGSGINGNGINGSGINDNDRSGNNWNGAQSSLPDMTLAPYEEQKITLKPLAQISNNAYILCEGSDGLYIVCQHRAHERILADRAIAQAEGRPVESQRLVIPFTTEVGPRALASIEENASLLKDLGFEVEAFGGASVLVRGVPTLVARGDYEVAFTDLLDELISGHGGRNLQERRRALLTMLSCKNAIKAGDTLQSEQMQRLIEDLLTVPNPSICPHGQPILIKISTLELDKKFEREYASR